MELNHTNICGNSSHEYPWEFITQICGNHTNIWGNHTNICGNASHEYLGESHEYLWEYITRISGGITRKSVRITRLFVGINHTKICENHTIICGNKSHDANSCGEISAWRVASHDALQYTIGLLHRIRQVCGHFCHRAAIQASRRPGKPLSVSLKWLLISALKPAYKRTAFWHLKDCLSAP